MSLGENLLKPTAMLYRNLVAMAVEESIRAYPLDSVVLLAGCDKTGPAQLMGAASADVPAIVLPGGPATPALFEGKRLGFGTDTWKYVSEVRAGTMSLEEFEKLEAAAMPSMGHCPEFGTAASMAAVTEALGMSMPGFADMPAMDSRKHQAAEATGRRAVEIAHEDLRPRQVLTAEAFDNAITVLMALGGSTNVVLHLLALAARVGVDLSLDRFDEISARSPLIANLKPVGTHLFEDLVGVGGIPSVLKILQPLLDLNVVGVSGERLGDALQRVDVVAFDDPNGGPVLSSLDSPFGLSGGLAVLHGNLAPSGALIKQAAATPSLLRHEGRAVVFEGIEDLSNRIDDPTLEVEKDDVLVLRNVGPVGGPGMPEWGLLPIPQYLVERGVRDMVRISDARMSGTAFGTVIVHVAPEAAVGGPLSRIRSGDKIRLDIDIRRLDVMLDAQELASRPIVSACPVPGRGYLGMYLRTVLQADHGCDLDFLASADFKKDNLPSGILRGWHGGW